MIYHPTILIIFSTLILLIMYKQDKLFNLVAISYPVLGMIALANFTGSYKFNFSFIELSTITSNNTILIGYAFMVSLLVSNLFAISCHRKNEVILGSAYGALSFGTLFAGDFVSMIICLELMMVTSSILIFIGGYRQSLRSAKKYFLTHLMTGNMIIIGIAYYFIKLSSAEIINLTSLVNNSEYSTLMFAIMLCGIVINMAAFPFSGWMVNYYPMSSPAGFPYLITFTTKVSVIVLLKLFAGYEPLKYIAIIMIIYSSVKAILENNIFSMLCLLSIMQMGFMMIGISYGGKAIIGSVVIYLFLHIIYKTLLSVSAATLLVHGKIENCTEIKKIKNHYVVAGFGFGILAMINIPGSATFLTKSIVTHNLHDPVLYYIITFLGMMTIISLPWHRYRRSKETVTLHLNLYNKASLIVAILAVIIVTFITPILPIYDHIIRYSDINLFSGESMKQLTVIGIAILICALFKKPKSHPNALNLLELIGDLLFYFYSYVDKKELEQEEKERWSYTSLERQILIKAETIHNQRTAIYIVFSIFIIMLITFIIRGI